MARTMSTTEIAAKAEANLRSGSGYSYSAAQIAAKAELGLVEGDVVQIGDNRLVYLGGSKIERQRRVEGEWQADGVVEVTDAQLDGLLIQVAAEAGRISIRAGI